MVGGNFANYLRTRKSQAIVNEKYPRFSCVIGHLRKQNAVVRDMLCNHIRYRFTGKSDGGRTAAAVVRPCADVSNGGDGDTVLNSRTSEGGGGGDTAAC